MLIRDEIVITSSNATAMKIKIVEKDMKTTITCGKSFSKINTISEIPKDPPTHPPTTLPTYWNFACETPLKKVTVSLGLSYIRPWDHMKLMEYIA
jgi:hypothetical protein